RRPAPAGGWRLSNRRSPRAHGGEPKKFHSSERTKRSSRSRPFSSSASEVANESRTKPSAPKAEPGTVATRNSSSRSSQKRALLPPSGSPQNLRSRRGRTSKKA